MSVRWMTHIWENGPRDGTQRAILLAIADHVGEGGSDAWPSIPKLVDKTQFSESTVKRSLNELDLAGWLDRKPGKGRSTTVYRLNWIPVPKQRVQPEPSQVESRGSTVNPQRVQPDPSEGSKSPAPLMLLTTNEPSGNREAYTNTLSGEKAAKGERKATVSASPPGQPSPKSFPNPKPEARTLVDRIVCSSPWGTLRSMRVSDVTPVHRNPVLTACKHEAMESGISQMQALEGLLQVIQAQVESVPRDELRFLGDLKTYFGNRNYRIGAKELTGGSNGKHSGKGRAIESTLREFLGRGANPAGVGEDGRAALDGPRRALAGGLHR